jgi:hypothetical protein
LAKWLLEALDDVSPYVTIKCQKKKPECVLRDDFRLLFEDLLRMSPTNACIPSIVPSSGRYISLRITSLTSSLPSTSVLHVHGFLDAWFYSAFAASVISRSSCNRQRCRLVAYQPRQSAPASRLPHDGM